MVSLVRYLKNRPRIFVYLLASHVLLGLVPLIVLAFVTYRQFREFAASQIVEANLQRLKQAESHVGLVMDQIEEKTDEFIFTVRHMRLDQIHPGLLRDVDTVFAVRRVTELLDNLVQTSSLIHSAYYYNAERRFIMTSFGHALPVARYHDRDWSLRFPGDRSTAHWLPTRVALNRSIRDDVRLGTLFRQLGFSDDRVLTFVKPVSKYIADFGGYVLVNIDVQAISRWIDLGARDDHGEFLVLGESGGIYLSTGDFALGARHDEAVIERAQEASEGFVITYSDDEARMHYFVVGANRWRYVLVADAGEYQALLRDIGRLTILLALVLSAIAVVVSLVLSGRMYHPIDRILSQIGAAARARGVNELSSIQEALHRAVESSRALREFVDRSAQGIKESTVRRLLTGADTDSSSLLERLGYCGYSLEKPFFFVAVLVVPRADRLSNFAIVRFCENLGSADVEIVAVTMDIDKTALLINADSHQAVRKLMLGVLETVSTSFDGTGVLVVGAGYRAVVQASQSYLEALAVLHQRVFSEPNEVIFVDDIGEVSQTQGNSELDAEDRVVSALKLGQTDEACRAFNSFLDGLYVSSGGDRIRMETACMGLLASVIKITERAGGDACLGRGNLYREFMEQDYSLASIRDWFHQLFASVIESSFAFDARYERYREPIRAYIDAHYDEDITLEQVADSIGISYSYIRKIFSKLFGLHFPEYLNDLRIDASKSLLTDTRLAVAHVAARVGYTNEQRFYRNFKRRVGCTPKEYRLAGATLGDSSS